MAEKRTYQVVIVGAGPVGMFAALTLKAAGIDVGIFDSGRRTVGRSYALVLHADTLRVLDGERLGQAARAEGRLIEHLGLFDGADLRRDIGLEGGVLVLPQDRLESILEAELDRRGVKVRWDHRVSGIEPDRAGVRLVVAKLDKVSTGYPVAHTEFVVDKEFPVEARYVIGADGYDSFVRRRLGIRDTVMGPAQMYSVFQFEAEGDVPARGCLMLEPNRVGGYWPLPSGKVRFSFPIDAESDHVPDGSRLGAMLSERAPWFTAKPGPIAWSAAGLFERKLAASFGSGRVWLAGDAAHLTGPLGAQSMNVGLREARDLAQAIATAIGNDEATGSLESYAQRAMAEWRGLLSPEPKAGDWRSMLRPCLPATGNTLDTLLSQV